MVTDPICGMAVNEQSAAGSLRDARTDYFFCSTDCLNQFAARIESLVRLKRVSVQIGTISEVHGPVVEIVCDRLLPLHQALYASIDHEAYTFEAHQHLDEKRVRAVALNRTSGLKRGMPMNSPGMGEMKKGTLTIYAVPKDKEKPYVFSIE